MWKMILLVHNFFSFKLFMDSCSVSEHVLGKVRYLAFLTEIQSSLRNFFLLINTYIYVMYSGFALE